MSVLDGTMKKITALLNSVDHGSFTEAAELMAYSPSAISRMVSDLETEWNITLLKRGRNGVSLTPMGLLLVPYIKNIYKECLHLNDKISELNSLQSGKLRIGAISSVATHLLPGAIQEYRKEYPNAEFEIMSGNYTVIEQWLHNGRIDVGFLSLPTLSKLDFTPLMQDRLLAVLPEDHPMADVEKFPTTSIPDFPFILLQQDDLSEITRYLKSIHVSPNTYFNTIDDYAIMSMVEKGLGISILPELILRRNPYRIVTKELTTPAYRTIGFAVCNKDEIPRMVSQFLKYVEGACPQAEAAEET